MLGNTCAGLRTSAASWRTHLYHVLECDLGFTACPADPDVLMHTATRVDGRKYYDYKVFWTTSTHNLS
jgi:hypothetical protein